MWRSPGPIAPPTLAEETWVHGLHVALRAVGCQSPMCAPFEQYDLCACGFAKLPWLQMCRACYWRSKRAEVA